MRPFEAEADIASSPEKSWKLLTDAPGYPAWNPTVERIEGTIGPEQTIKSFVKVSPGPMLPLIWPSVPDLTDSFQEFAQALKAAAEKGDS